MAIVDLPLYWCRACGATWLGDNQMYEDPDRCPRCGTFRGDPAKDEGGISDVKR